jgi:hypothetical protein
MAEKTRCLTPGVIYHTFIQPERIGISATLKTPVVLSEEDAKELETLLHNQVELVLAAFVHAKTKGI